MASTIKVVCRFRPQNKKEIAKGAEEIIEISPDGTTVKVGKAQPKTFNFDRIFPQSTTQLEIYNYAAKPVIDDLFKGYNGTIFAYGQTGSGKTHTMQGPDIHDAALKGIIPRMIETIFSEVAEAPETLEFLVKVSYIEIYMERIRDLLNPENMDLKVRENRDKSVYVEGVTEVYVTCEEEVTRVMDTGQDNRKVAATNMNDVSSRSHSIFILTVEQKNLTTGSTMRGKLYLVDLAGSEKVGKTGATGQTLDEAKGINKSLSALGNVINALTDGKSKHIPYRDSKLTRILQESLGGNSRTTLVINCSPSSYNEEETLSTLRFGIRAKTIKNKAKVNQDMSVEELKQLLAVANKEIARLNSYIAGMEEELRLYRGDSPAKLPVKNLIASESAPKLLSPDSRSKLPNVAKIQDRCNELEEKLKEAEEEKRKLLEKQDSLEDELRDKEQELTSELEKAKKFKEELEQAIAAQEEFEKENQIMVGKLAEMTISQEKLEYEKNESQMMMDSLNEQIDNLTKQLEVLQKDNAQLQEFQKKYEEQEAAKKEELKKKKRAELEAQQSQFLQKAKEIRKSLEIDVSQIQEILSGSSEDSKASPSVPVRERTTVSEETIQKAAAPSGQQEQANSSTATVSQEQRARIAELEQRLKALEEENQKLAQENECIIRHRPPVSEPDAAISSSSEALKQQNSLKQEEVEEEDLASQLGLDEVEVDVAVMEPLDEEEDGLLDRWDSSAASTKMSPKSGDTPAGNIVDEGAAVGGAVGEGSTGVESFEMEMLRTEMEEQKGQISKLEAERKRHLQELEKVKKEYEERLAKMQKEREAEQSQQNEDKRIKLEQELNDLRQKTATKLTEFDALKTSLLRDLQNRCEKVIDLEMLLDEAREQYEQLLKNSSNKSLQKRNMFLERNLEQLTRVHQQLVNQNNALRLEKKVSEKKLAARNQRISGLEVLLASAQEKLQQQAESHAAAIAKYKELVEELKAKLEAAMKRRQRSTSFNPGGHARIARPIRGGGGKKGPAAGPSGGSNGGDVVAASPAASKQKKIAAVGLDAADEQMSTPKKDKQSLGKHSDKSASEKKSFLSLFSSKGSSRASSPLKKTDSSGADGFTLHSNIIDTSMAAGSAEEEEEEEDLTVSTRRDSVPGNSSPYKPPL